MKLKVRRTFEAQTKTKPLIDSAGRPALSVTCGDSSPKGGAKTCLYCTCIGAFLPLPSGEVTMPSGIDGDGDVGGDAHIAPPYITQIRIGAFLPLPSGEVAAA